MNQASPEFSVVPVLPASKPPMAAPVPVPPVITPSSIWVSVSAMRFGMARILFGWSLTASTLPLESRTS